MQNFLILHHIESCGICIDWVLTINKKTTTKRIDKYLKLNDYKHNNINIFKLYLSTYSKKQTITLNENTYDYEIFAPDKIHNIPVLNNGLRTDTYTALNAISHNI